MIQWDVEVANRCKAKCDDPNVVLNFRKSVPQLQKHCDKCEKKKSQATLVQENNPNEDRLDHMMRETRHAMPATQAAVNCQPTTCTNTGGRAAFGAPTALNTGGAAAAFQHNVTLGMGTGPFQVQTITQAVTVANILDKKFKTNACCWRCGFPKKNHNQLSLPFGRNCDHNCYREDCSKCGERIRDFHDNPNLAGPLCAQDACTGSPILNGAWCVAQLFSTLALHFDC